VRLWLPSEEGIPLALPALALRNIAGYRQVLQRIPPFLLSGDRYIYPRIMIFIVFGVGMLVVIAVALYAIIDRLNKVVILLAKLHALKSKE
jgi:hypothetical protein